MGLDFGPSQRALATFDQGPAWDLMQKVKKRPSYDADSQPDGLINLSGALNSLMDDWMAKYVKSVPQVEASTTIRYGPIFGSQGLLNAAAGFFNAFFKPYSPVVVDNILAANGVTSLIDMIAWTLCSPGDGVVYLTPNFYMLEYDLTSRAGVSTVAVSTSDLEDPFGAGGVEELIHALDLAVDEAERTRHIRCRVLFICNPANPQGRCYAPETLRSLASWCRKRTMHLVADEIYAMSVFDTVETTLGAFSSVLSIPVDNTEAQHIHCLYGLSKDFNMGGLRMGFLVTRNAAVRTAASRVAWFTWLTAFSDRFVTRFLERQDLVTEYINIYQQRLGAAYLGASRALRENQIPFAPSNAGLFIFIDLSAWVVFFQSGHDPATKPSPELQLCEWLLDRGVFLNAGEFAGSDRPGYFRLVFTGNPDSTIVAIGRIRGALDELDKLRMKASLARIE